MPSRQHFKKIAFLTVENRSLRYADALEIHYVAYSLP